MKHLLAIALLGAPFGAQAQSLQNSSVNIEYELAGQVVNGQSFAVNIGVEASCPDPGLSICSVLTVPSQSIDFGESWIRYAHSGAGAAFLPVSPNRLGLTALDEAWVELAGVQLDTNIANLDMGRVSWTASSIWVDMSGLQVQDGGYFQFNLDLRTPVPEPSSTLLLGAGLGLLAWRRRR